MNTKTPDLSLADIESKMRFSSGRYDGLIETLRLAESRAIASFLNGADDLANLWRQLRDDLHDKCEVENNYQNTLREQRIALTNQIINQP